MRQSQAAPERRRLERQLDQVKRGDQRKRIEKEISFPHINFRMTGRLWFHPVSLTPPQPEAGRTFDSTIRAHREHGRQTLSGAVCVSNPDRSGRVNQNRTGTRPLRSGCSCKPFSKVFPRGKEMFCMAKKRRAPSFPKAPFIVSMAISRILSAPNEFRAG
jgi:hypothetical protein